MESVDQTPAAHARKSESILLQRLAEHGQKAVADALEVDISTISRMADPSKAGSWHGLCVALETLGLKIVDADERTVDPAQWAALLTLAEQGFSALKGAAK